jgi:FixJ family two-component response regulator
MSLARVISHELQPLHISNAKPIVFVIDHDVSVRKTLESLIHCGGWQSKTFASAHEFLARPRPTVPSCLVLDVFLPDLNGLELQKRVAVERPNTPIIFITDQPDVYTSVQAMKAGAVEFLVKPFDDDILLARFRNVLNGVALLLAAMEKYEHCVTPMHDSASANSKSWPWWSLAC